MRDLEYFKNQYNQVEKVLGFNANNIAQGSDEWLFMRLGVITGSNCHLICGTDKARKTYMDTLIAEVMMAEAREQVHAKPLAWGHMNEKFARNTYEQQLQAIAEIEGRPMEDGTITEVPFCYKDLRLRVAASLDGAIFHMGNTVEIKCPYNPVHHVEFNRSGKIKEEYEFQVQHGMYCTDADLCHFGSFEPRFTEKKLIVKVIERNEVFMNLFDDAYEQFIYDMDKRLRTEWGVEFGKQWNLEAYKELQEIEC